MLTLSTMQLVAMIEQALDDNLEQRTEAARELVVEADAYDDAVVMIRDQLPAGWRIIWLRAPERG